MGGGKNVGFGAGDFVGDALHRNKDLPQVDTFKFGCARRFVDCVTRSYPGSFILCLWCGTTGTEEQLLVLKETGPQQNGRR